jgi:hypothetical protein
MLLVRFSPHTLPVNARLIPASVLLAQGADLASDEHTMAKPAAAAISAKGKAAPSVGKASGKPKSVDLDQEIAEHQAQLEALKESDPEFYQHLLEV